MMVDPSARLLALQKQLGASSALDPTLKAVVDCAVELIAAPRVSIRLLDPEHGALAAIARAGSPLHKNPRVTYDLGEGLLGWIAKHGKPLRSDDAMADERFVKRPDMVETMGSFLGAPVIVDGAVVGVLSAVAPEQNAFTQAHEDVLMRIAALAAPYVDAARRKRIEQVARG